MSNHNKLAKVTPRQIKIITPKGTVNSQQTKITSRQNKVNPQKNKTSVPKKNTNPQQIATDSLIYITTETEERKRRHSRRRLLCWIIIGAILLCLLLIVAAILLSLYFTKTGIFSTKANDDSTTTVSMTVASNTSLVTTNTTVSTATTSLGTTTHSVTNSSMLTVTTTTTTIVSSTISSSTTVSNTTSMPNTTTLITGSTSTTTSSTTSITTASTSTTTSSTISTTTASISTTTSSTTTASTSTTTSSTTTASTSTTTSSTTSTTTVTTTTALVPCANMQWNATGVTVAGTGVSGTGANQLSSPWNIFVDSNNNLFIADSGNHRIQRWAFGASSGTTVAGITGSPGSTATQLNRPYDIYVDSFQNMYVADQLNSRIQYFMNGSTNGITVTTGWGVGNIWGVQVLFSNTIYGCDLTNGIIWKNRTAVAGNNSVGSNSNQLNQPQGFAIDASMNVGTAYIANTQQHTIVQWAPGNTTGTVVAGTNGVLGSTPLTLKYPVGLKLDQYGNLFVVDNNNHRIQLFCRYPTVNATGRTIVGTGILGNSSTTLNYPAGLALDSQLNLYVSDTSNHRIQKFARIV